MRIIEEVAEKHRTSPRWIKTKVRFPDLVRIRDEAIWRCRHETGLSYVKIGQVFDMDHTSVRDACRRHDLRGT